MACPSSSIHNLVWTMIGYMSSSPGSEREHYFHEDMKLLQKAFPTVKISSRDYVIKRCGGDTWRNITKLSYELRDEIDKLPENQKKAIEFALISIHWA